MDSQDEQLKIVISAIDNASAVLKQLASNTSEATGQVSTSTEAASSSFGTLVGSIVTAQAAYQALSAVYTDVKAFFESSIQNAIQASGTMAQVKIDVQNAGLSYDTLGPQIEAVSKKNATLGFTQEDTSLSLGKLVLATGNYNQALALNQLAMDLSRAKNIDLNTATVLVQQVMAGNTRVLKQYGISLDSATTSAQALDILQQKLQGSSEAFAQTSAGKMAEVQAQWQDLQVQVGDAFMPVLTEVFNAFEQYLPQITSFLVDMGQGMATDIDNIITIGQDTQVFAVLGAVVQTVAGYFSLLSNAIGATADYYRELMGQTQEYANSQEQVSTGMQKIIDGWNTLHPAQKITDAQWQQLDTTLREHIITQVDAADKSGKLTAAVTGSGSSFAGITNHITAANNAVVKHSDAVAKLQTDYDKMKDAGATDLADLSSAFQTKMTSINDSIAKTQQSITDLTTSYNDTQKSQTTTVAESIVASEKKVADIKAQLAESTSATQTENLNEQLKAEQENYDSSLAFRQSHQNDIAVAEARANETDLQRTIDDYNAKEAVDTDAYNKKLATLTEELSDKKKEGEQETELYQNKVAQINKILDEGNAYFEKLSASRLSTTTKEVDAEIAKFQALTAAVGGTKSANASSLSTVSIPSLPVSGSSPASVAAGGNVNLHFNFNGTVAGDAGIQQIITKTVQSLNRTSTLKQFAGA